MTRQRAKAALFLLIFMMQGMFAFVHLDAVHAVCAHGQLIDGDAEAASASEVPLFGGKEEGEAHHHCLVSQHSQSTFEVPNNTAFVAMNFGAAPEPWLFRFILVSDNHWQLAPKNSPPIYS